MDEVNFAGVENKIMEILARKNHNDVEVKRMWFEDQVVVVNLGYKKERGQIIIPTEHFYDKSWLDTESKINDIANQLKQKAARKSQNKQK